jgi:hypothetical protein
VTATTILERLDGVKRLRADRWLARCPAHDDRQPSLSIRELPDGLVLVHDFAGCAVQDVLSAVGLRLDDLFPDRTRDDHRAKRTRAPLDTKTALLALTNEITVVGVYATAIRAGQVPSHADHERFLFACSTIVQAQRYCDGS